MTPQAASAPDSPAPLRPMLARPPAAPAAPAGAAAGFATLVLSSVVPGPADAQQPAPGPPGASGPPSPAIGPDAAALPCPTPTPDLPGPPGPGLATAAPAADSKAKPVPSSASKARQDDDAPTAAPLPGVPALPGVLALPTSASPAPVLQDTQAAVPAGADRPPAAAPAAIPPAPPQPAAAEPAGPPHPAPLPAAAPSGPPGPAVAPAGVTAPPGLADSGDKPSGPLESPAMAVQQGLAAPPPLPVSGPPASGPPAAGPTAAVPHAQPLAGQLGPAFYALAPAGPARLVVRLDPAELGPVQVGITRPPDGPPQVELTAERPETLLLLMRDQPALHRALDLAGVPAEGRTLHFQLGTPHLGTPDPAPAPAPAAHAGTGSLGGSLGQGTPGGAGSGMAGGRGQPQGWPGRTDSPGNLPASHTRPPARPRAGIDITA